MSRDRACRLAAGYLTAVATVALAAIAVLPYFRLVAVAVLVLVGVPSVGLWRSLRASAEIPRVAEVALLVAAFALAMFPTMFACWLSATTTREGLFGWRTSRSDSSRLVAQLSGLCEHWYGLGYTVMFGPLVVAALVVWRCDERSARRRLLPL